MGAEAADDAKRSVPRAHHYEGYTAALWAALKNAASQPLDLAACPWLGFGCRFLRLDHRTLLANSPPADILVRLSTGTSDDLEKDLAHFEGLFLRERTLRFADLRMSKLYAADLNETDLRGAKLNGAWLQGAQLGFSKLQDAHLRRAEFKGAQLFGAQLQGANLYQAQLQAVDLRNAELRGADARRAELPGAFLSEALLQGAFLWQAQMQSADLELGQLQGTMLCDARLQGAPLQGAQLQGATLIGAELEGANLVEARLQGADLRGARLWQTAVNAETNLSLADLRKASWQAIDENETAKFEIIGTLPVAEDWQNGKARLERLIAPGEQTDEAAEFALDGVLLVDDVNDPRWQRLDRARLTADERAYDEALVRFLADLARSDPDAARGLASRMEGEEPRRAARLTRVLRSPPSPGGRGSSKAAPSSPSPGGRGSG